MFTQALTVNYLDGTTTDVTTTQADVAAWEMWTVKRGLRASAPDRTVMQDMPVTFLRFVAWSALHRPGTGPRPDFDLWADQVAEVAVEDAEPADPTPTVTQGD
jgi:hypothetical protein